MLSYPNTGTRVSFAHTLAPFLDDPGLPFADVLPADTLQQAFDDEGVTFGTSSRSIFTPALTLWAFLSQVLRKDPSCRAAVLRVLVLLTALKAPPCAVDTAAYCRARAKLPAPLLRRLTQHVGQRLDDAAPTDWHWKGKRVRLADGTTRSLPDTPENQQAYPQPPCQKPGLGFPLLRVVVLRSLATAALIDAAWGPYQGKETGEPALWRQLLGSLAAGDVVVADRFYCSYWMVALLSAHGVDVVLRLHHRRDYDFRRGKRLGQGDHVVRWQRPERPEWMSVEQYETIPKEIEVRELQVTIATPGCRTKQGVVVTTLLDTREYAKEEVAELYHQRWQAELDIRSIKTALGMDPLRCKTPFLVEKEIWAYFLGDNLVRKVAAQAARQGGVEAGEVSFTATQQALCAGWDRLTTASAEERRELIRNVLQGVSGEQVGDRPDRWEPRAVKRRPKPHDWLTEPRAQAWARLLEAG